MAAPLITFWNTCSHSSLISLLFIQFWSHFHQKCMIYVGLSSEIHSSPTLGFPLIFQFYQDPVFALFWVVCCSTYMTWQHPSNLSPWKSCCKPSLNNTSVTVHVCSFCFHGLVVLYHNKSQNLYSVLWDGYITQMCFHDISISSLFHKNLNICFEMMFL